MTGPASPATPPENDEPLFDEVVDELGYNPAHPEELSADSAGSESSESSGSSGSSNSSESGDPTSPA